MSPIKLVKTASKIEKLGLENDKILRLYRKNVINEEDLQSQLQEIKEEKQILFIKKREIEIRMNNKKHIDQRLSALKETIQKMQYNIDRLNFDGKRKIIDLVLDKVIIKKDKGVEIEMVIPDFNPSYSTSPQEVS